MSDYKSDKSIAGTIGGPDEAPEQDSDAEGLVGPMMPFGAFGGPQPTATRSTTITLPSSHGGEIIIKIESEMNPMTGDSTTTADVGGDAHPDDLDRVASLIAGMFSS